MFSPRYTYPVPPYSTVLGLLANIMGDQLDLLFSENFGLTVLCSAETISKEYTWFRNLNSKYFKQRQNGEHPGGVVPSTVYVLNDVEAHIYLIHNKQVTTIIKENVYNPTKWLSHLHLGRSEDWIEIKGIDDVKITIGNKPSDYSGGRKYSQWMPDPNKANGEYVFLPSAEVANQIDYGAVYNNTRGLVNIITSTYKISPLGHRDFEYVPVRLFNGQVAWLSPTRYPSLLCDPYLKVPLFFFNVDLSRQGDD